MKPKKCKQCRKIFTPVKPLQSVCDWQCAKLYAEAKRIKQEANLRRIERKKTKEALNDIKPKSEWLRDAQRWFNKYIRLRDAHLPCISCKRYHTGQYHAGHYRSTGSSPHLRFDEKNVHKQCSACNNYLSGNIQLYRIGLLEKIGNEAVERLENDNKTRNLSIDEIKAIKAKYKSLCYEMEKGIK